MGYRSFSLRFVSSLKLSGWLVRFLWGGGELVLSVEGGHLCNSRVPPPFRPAPFNPTEGRGIIEQGGQAQGR